ncbi:MAG: zinc finger domain-containing protein [Planctomycetota bacterium]
MWRRPPRCWHLHKEVSAGGRESFSCNAGRKRRT